MSVYCLEVKKTVGKKRLLSLGSKFCCYKKIINATSIAAARAIAAEDAKIMGDFDSPKAWRSNTITSCKKVTPNTDSGVLSSEYIC